MLLFQQRQLPPDRVDFLWLRIFFVYMLPKFVVLFILE